MEIVKFNSSNPSYNYLTSTNFIKFLFIFALGFLFSQTGIAQGCTELPSGVVVNVTGISGTNCDYNIDLCVEVPNSPRPKRIDYLIEYDSNGNGIKDASQSFSFAPGGSIPSGTHCLSSMAPSEAFDVFSIPCGTTFDVTITGYTNNSGGTGGACATSLGTIDEFNGFMPINPLPVELVEFTGQSYDENNVLRWVTATEDNVDYFSIERMGDDIVEFEEVGRVLAAGNSIEMLSYKWDDFDPLYLGYYRLKIVDFDGYTEYSEIVSIEKSVEEFAIHSVFPNPITTVTNIEFTAMERMVTMEVYNIQGQLIMLEEVDVEEGLNYHRLDMTYVSNGMYILKINDGRNTIQKKLIKK